MDREYVIVCNRHKGDPGCALLFWGAHTDDDHKRSFGGYTSDLVECERYTLDETNDHGYHFPVYDESMSRGDFLDCDDIVIKVDQLWDLGYKTKRIVY